MARAVSVIMAAGVLFCLCGLAASLSGLALTGPDQSFTIPKGGSKTSYLRIWNEGDQTASVRILVNGSAAPMITPSSTTIQLAPGESRVIDLTYRVPADQPSGLFQGTIEILTGGTLATSLVRPVMVMVTGSGETTNLLLDRGLNLVSWPGPDRTFAEAFASAPGVRRVWRRTSSGSYVSASYYEGAGWWSADASFTYLRHGEAYFIECSAPCEVAVARSSESRVIQLKKGLNLVGWVGAATPISQAFPQTGSYHPISKIWRRSSAGEYKAVQYFPEQGLWWSSDSSFTSLQPNAAYFIECDQDASFTVMG